VSREVRSQAPVLRAQSNPLAPAVVGDPQLGQIFRNMRAAMRLPRDTIARRLATSVATIEDLESGAVSALPHWPETVRIVRGYCELLRLDPEPLLWRLQQLLRQGTSVATPAAPAPGAGLPLALRGGPVMRESGGRERLPRRRGGGLRRVLVLAALPVAAAGLAYLVVLAPAIGYRIVARLPASIAAPARAALDTLVLYAAPRRNGLRWIDVGNPRLRKGDKLRTKAR
jgi:hypothetical protein